jgi:hypothetical protein
MLIHKLVGFGQNVAQENGYFEVLGKTPLKEMEIQILLIWGSPVTCDQKHV